MHYMVAIDHAQHASNGLHDVYGMWYAYVPSLSHTTNLEYEASNQMIHAGGCTATSMQMSVAGEDTSPTPSTSAYCLHVGWNFLTSSQCHTKR